MSVDDECLPERTGVPVTSHSANNRQQLTGGHCPNACLHLYDDSYVATTANFGPGQTSDRAEFYVDDWSTEAVEPREVCVDDTAASSRGAEVGDAAGLLGLDADVLVRDAFSTEGRPQGDLTTEIGVTPASDNDSVAAVKPSARDVTARRCDAAVTEEESSSVVGRDETAVDGRLVVHDYGEMWSIFREIPLWVDVLRAQVVERHNADPRISRLLLRYPSLRPGTWVWTSPPRLHADTRRTAAADDGPAPRPPTTCSVTDCWSYAVVPVIETCTLVISASCDVTD